jgi:hypothetical protein
VERLRFDAVRCELQFSKGVAGNIEEAADEIERLRAALQTIFDRTYDGDPIKYIARVALNHQQKRGDE